MSQSINLKGDNYFQFSLGTSLSRELKNLYEDIPLEYGKFIDYKFDLDIIKDKIIYNNNKMINYVEHLISTQSFILNKIGLIEKATLLLNNYKDIHIDNILGYADFYNYNIESIDKINILSEEIFSIFNKGFILSEENMKEHGFIYVGKNKEGDLDYIKTKIKDTVDIQYISENIQNYLDNNLLYTYLYRWCEYVNKESISLEID